MKKVKYNIEVELINYNNPDDDRVVRKVEYIFDYDSISGRLADGKHFGYSNGFSDMYDYFEEYILEERFERDKKWFNILSFKETVIK